MEEVYQLNFISSLHIQQASIVDTLYLYRRLGFSSQFTFNFMFEFGEYVDDDKWVAMFRMNKHLI